jgi:hypothetical protein
MHNVFAAVLCAGALALAAPAQSAAPIQLPALARLASQLSGLKQKKKLKVVILSGPAIEKQALRLLDRDYPADQQAYDENLYRALGLLAASEPLRPVLVSLTKGVRGLYDPISTTLYARRSSDVRQTLVHEIIHALQDQAFNLRRVTALRRGSRDAASAASAAFEGSATFFSDVLGQRRLQLRSPQSHTGKSRARLFLELEQAFAYTTGLRFIASLQNVGGRPAIYSALRRMPETTEQVFHLDAFLAREQPVPLELPTSAGGFSLARDDSFGELDVRALLAVYQIPRLDHVGDGWGAGLSALYRAPDGATAFAVRLDWDNELDAREWDEAVTFVVNEAFDADTTGVPPTTACKVQVCWSLGRRQIAFSRNETRTVLVVGSSLSSVEAVASGIVPAALP